MQWCTSAIQVVLGCDADEMRRDLQKLVANYVCSDNHYRAVCRIRQKAQTDNGGCPLTPYACYAICAPILTKYCTHTHAAHTNHTHIIYSKIISVIFYLFNYYSKLRAYLVIQYRNDPVPQFFRFSNQMCLYERLFEKLN